MLRLSCSSWSSWSALLASLPLACALSACTDDGGPAGETDEATQTSSQGEESGESGETGDEPDPEPDPELPDPPPVAPSAEPEPLAGPTWVLGTVYGEGDGVRAAIEDESFELPTPGEEAYGVQWAEHEPTESGGLQGSNGSSLYAAAEVPVEADQHLIVRTSRVRGVYTNNANFVPGLVYTGGWYYGALEATPGEDNLVVVQALSVNGNLPEAKLYTTPDELVFNLADLTAPSYPPGEPYAQWIGAPILNPTQEHAYDVRAHVIGSEWVEDTVVMHGGIPAGTTSQVAFSLVPKQLPEPGESFVVRLRVEPLHFDWSYEREVEISVVESGSVFRRTRRSGVDGSVQYAGVRAPDPAGAEDPGLILTLHGAGVQGAGQAAAMANKDWAYIVAPTNRRPYGFDWEEWGRLDAIEALDDALAAYPVDDTNVHLTGHSMGGHGTWHVGIHFPQRFAVIGPSAGWISFDTYGGPAIPFGVVGAARAASKTLDFLPNLGDRAVYILHGLADNNVPAQQGQQMFDYLQDVTPDLWFHGEPGAGHWWDNDPDTPGTACVDWPPMMEEMVARSTDPRGLDFDFISAGPWVNPTRAYATIRSADSPLERPTLSSRREGDTLRLTTTNVRSLEIDTAMLADQGVSALEVDGESVELGAGASVLVGPEEGKHPEVYGPLNQVFMRPFCFVWPDDAPPEYADYAAFLSSWWAVQGNGQACGVPLSRLRQDVRANMNLIWLGFQDSSDLPDLPDSLQLSWNAEGIDFGGQVFDDVALGFVYPGDNGRLSAAFVTPAGSERLLFRYMPFSSRNGYPDYYIWRANGPYVGGFFDAQWQLSPDYVSYLQ